jgi:hypothetical protein
VGDFRQRTVAPFLKRFISPRVLLKTLSLNPLA